MATTGTYTNLEICEDALIKAGILGIGEPAQADDIQLVLRNLNRMLKAWQNRGAASWLYERQSVTLTTAASYTMSPARPARIINVNIKRGGIETPMQELTRTEYETLPLKTSSGVPTCWHYSKGRTAPLIYIWPVLATASGETLEITYEREIEDVVLTAVSDIPSEWYDAAVYGLAARIGSDYMAENSNIVARAEIEFNQAMAADREGSVFFAGPYAT